MSTFPSSPSSPRSSHRRHRARRPAAQPFARIVDLVHDTTDGLPGPTLVGVTYHPTDLSIGTWPLDDTGDPLSSLLGWIAPPAWDALGISGPTDSWVHGASGGALRCTVLLERTAEAIMLTEVPGGAGVPTPAFVDPIADVLARCLGRPTPPPATTPASWVELRWLHAVATTSLQQPDALTWPQVAARHPLHRSGEVAPETLALATLTAEHHDSWTACRARSELAADVAQHPTGGRALPLPDWFDDGSFSRWVARDLPAPSELLDAVLATVPEPVGEAILATLVAS